MKNDEHCKARPTGYSPHVGRKTRTKADQGGIPGGPFWRRRVERVRSVVVIRPAACKTMPVGMGVVSVAVSSSPLSPSVSEETVVVEVDKPVVDR